MLKVNYSKIRVDCIIKGIDYNFINKTYKDKEYELQDVLIRDMDSFVSALEEVNDFSDRELKEYLYKNNVWVATEHDCLNIILSRNGDNENYIVELKQGNLLKIDKTLQWRMFFTLEQLSDIINNWETWKKENNI